MKMICSTLVVAFMSFALAGAGAGVAQAASNVTVIKSIPETGSKSVKVPAGNTVKFQIPSNATTGYSYTVKTTNNTAESKVSKPKYVAPTAAMPGQGGTTVVTVVPQHSGMTTVTFTNVAPGGAVASVSSVKLTFMN